MDDNLKLFCGVGVEITLYIFLQHSYNNNTDLVINKFVVCLF